MLSQLHSLPMGQAAALAAAPVLLLLFARWARSKWLTLRASSPTPVVARLMAGIVSTHKYSEKDFFGVDGAPESIQAKRRAGMERLSKAFEAAEGPKAKEYNDKLRGLSDIRFTDTNRVPHQFQPVVRAKLRLGFIAEASKGPYIIDVDGNKALDISGSYGVNVHGYTFYKQCMSEGLSRVEELGPNVLGPLHPAIFDVLKHLTAVSGQDEVSFHMSGTEAVMCAVRLCRFNTKRKLIVQFAGAYHGWWDGVQPGPGNERLVHDTLTLKDLSPLALKLIKARRHEIAAVLVSPLQGLNPGSAPPSDLVLMDSKVRKTADRDNTYRTWLQTLRATCSEAEVPLVFDEVYTGFRMAPGGAQEYYGVRADMVVYGKTLGGGMPVGVVCGKKELMARFDPEHPLRVSYVIGTFAAAPATLGPMSVFLNHVTTKEAAAKYENAQKLVDEWQNKTNKLMAAEDLPIRVDALTTVFTMIYKVPSRYHWMYQYYLRAEGLAMSWVGTGRCLFSLDFDQKHYDEVTEKMLAAARKMRDDGWWWDGVTAGAIKNQIVKEFVSAMFVPSFLKAKAM